MGNTRRSANKSLGTIALLSFVAVMVLATVQYYTTDQYTKIWPDGVLEVVNNTVITGLNCTAIVADTSEERAQAISDALTNKTGERPDTWMSWAMSLRSFNITLEAVQIQRFDGTYYYSDAIFHGLAEEEKLQSLEMRPSDAIALALRTGSPIYVNSTLLKEEGIDICDGSTGIPSG